MSLIGLTGSVIRAGKMGYPLSKVVTRFPEEGQLRPGREVDTFSGS